MDEAGDERVTTGCVAQATEDALDPNGVPLPVANTAPNSGAYPTRTFSFAIEISPGIWALAIWAGVKAELRPQTDLVPSGSEEHGRDVSKDISCNPEVLRLKGWSVKW